MEERISRTSGNVYEKTDKDTWMVFPKYEEKKYTSFVDVGNMTMSVEELDVDSIDIHEAIEDIMQIEI